MRILVTGSSGHLGEALMRTLRAAAHDAVGVDIAPSPYTDAVGSIADRDFVARCMRGAQAVLHAATRTSRTWPRMRARISSTPTSPAR